MIKLLKRVYFYVEPKTLLAKQLRDYNTYFFNYLLDNTKFANTQFFSFTLVFSNVETYEECWNKVPDIIIQLNSFFFNQSECIFFAYSIEMHRPKKIKSEENNPLDKTLRSIQYDTVPSFFINIRNEYNLDLEYEKGLLIYRYLSNTHPDGKKLIGLPHIHCVVGFDSIKSIEFNYNLLQEKLQSLFSFSYVIRVSIIQKTDKQSLLVNLCNSLNYILKCNIIDVDYNISLYDINLKTKVIYIYDKKFYDYFVKYISAFSNQKIYIFFLTR